MFTLGYSIFDIREFVLTNIHYRISFLPFQRAAPEGFSAHCSAPAYTFAPTGPGNRQHVHRALGDPTIDPSSSFLWRFPYAPPNSLVLWQTTGPFARTWYGTHGRLLASDRYRVPSAKTSPNCARPRRRLGVKRFVSTTNGSEH